VLPADTCLKKLVDVDGSGAIEIHHFECTIDVRELAIGMQRLIEHSAAISKFLKRDYLAGTQQISG